MNLDTKPTSIFLSGNFLEMPASPFFGAKELETKLGLQQFDDFFRNLLLSRNAFRKHCQVLNLKQPEQFFSKDFSKISAWLIKNQNFPAVLKTDLNMENCEGQYLLRAFRELPDFFEQVDSLSQGSGVIIEPFINAKGYIETTFFNGQLSLISQVSLTKELNFSQSWRMFPLKPPPVIADQVLSISQKILPLLKLKNIPTRLSFALTSSGLVLCSINAGWNRLEYFPEFSSDFGLASIAMLEQQKPSPLYFRIQFLENISAEEAISLSELKTLVPELLKIETNGGTCVFLLGSKAPLELSKAAKKLSSMLKKALAEPLISDED